MKSHPEGEACQTYEQITEEVKCELNRSGSEKIKRRQKQTRKIIMSLLRWQRLRAVGNKFRMRDRGAALTITEGNLIHLDKILTANVELKGKGIGSVGFSTEDGSCFFPKWDFAKDGVKQDPKDAVKWKWSRNSEDGRSIKKYLSRCKIELADAPPNEREIQYQLFKALRTARRKTCPALKNLRPVELAGCMMEYPTAIAGSDEKVRAGAGTTDLLVRHGSRGNATFCIFELKAPGRHDPYEVLRQAIRYMASLDQIANENASIQKAYRKVFGSKYKAPLKFGAVAVIEDRPDYKRHSVDAAIEALVIPDDARVGVLVYKAPNCKIDLSSLKWLRPVGKNS